MRSHNDMPLIAQTLAALRQQDTPFDLIALDNESTDGTVAELKKHTDRIITIPSGGYVPGRVLNKGMEVSEGEFAVFLNSDCTPQDPSWLRNLLAGFSDEGVAAVFGRQIPRPDCFTLYAKDIEDTYGDGARQKFWRHCFSMASSAIRRHEWERMKFSERVRYSEDIEWTWRARQQGRTIRYAPDSTVMHSHNYSLRALYRRQQGEGRAEAVIFDWAPWEGSFVRYSLLPYGLQVLRDWKYCVPRFALGGVLWSPVVRMAQLLGRRTGFRAGLKERST
jgi:rhamnosyltransferase